MALAYIRQFQFAYFYFLIRKRKKNINCAGDFKLPVSLHFSLFFTSLYTSPSTVFCFFFPSPHPPFPNSPPKHDVLLLIGFE